MPLTPIATPPPAYVPREGSGNAFDTYALAALDVEARAGEDLKRVAFYPAQRTRAMDTCAGTLRRIRGVGVRECHFEFVPRPPFTPGPYQRGWRLMARCLRWQAEDLAAKGDYDNAISTALVSARMGADLTGGGATDAALGLTMMDDARLALLPYLDKMGAAQLGRLADGITAVLRRKPAVTVPIQNEGQRVGLCVQAVQDAFKGNDFKALESNLGTSVRDSIEKLNELRGKDRDVQAYFADFLAEGQAQTAKLTERAGISAADRAARDAAEKEARKKQRNRKARPWSGFAKHFFSTALPLIDQDDRTVARTRMFALTATLLQWKKAGRPLPRDLSAFPREVTLDPYDFGSLRLSDDGLDFVVYSVGANFRDDGGDTDESWQLPDLTLERTP